MIIRFIIEIIARPKEMVDKTLREVVKVINSRYKVVNEDYSDVELVPNSSLFSGFVEVEFKVKNFEELFDAMLDFGPTIVEVVEPNEIKISSAELQASLSDLLNKIHEMSKIINALKIENLKLKNNNTTTKK